VIRLDRVSKSFPTAGGRFTAVDDVSFEVGEGQLCVLIGPSGSGKTTTMRLINRLERVSAGRITIAGTDVATMDEVKLRRGIGYVIQQGGLLPHLTVANNVALVPRLLGWPGRRRRERAEELLALVGLPPAEFADRYPRQLSGGQQQRVGVARALAADPPIVLMDEPFGAVDPITRKQLQREMRRIQAEVRKTVVFVTHDIGEAFLLGDRVILMDGGRVVQDGTPADLIRRPASAFVTDFIGEDRGLRALRYTSLGEIGQAGGPGRQRPMAGEPGTGEPVLPAALSVLDALPHLGRLGGAAGGGVWIGDGGRATAFLTYRRLVEVLGESVAPHAEPAPLGDHAVSPA
jgi:osmoprotectant transport system ATP-binding protein